MVARCAADKKAIASIGMREYMFLFELLLKDSVDAAPTRCQHLLAQLAFANRQAGPLPAYQGYAMFRTTGGFAASTDAETVLAETLVGAHVLPVHKPFVQTIRRAGIGPEIGQNAAMLYQGNRGALLTLGTREVSYELLRPLQGLEKKWQETACARVSLLGHKPYMTATGFTCRTIQGVDGDALPPFTVPFLRPDLEEPKVKGPRPTRSADDFASAVLKEPLRLRWKKKSSGARWLPKEANDAFVLALLDCAHDDDAAPPEDAHEEEVASDSDIDDNDNDDAANPTDDDPNTLSEWAKVNEKYGVIDVSGELRDKATRAALGRVDVVHGTKGMFLKAICSCPSHCDSSNSASSSQPPVRKKGDRCFLFLSADTDLYSIYDKCVQWLMTGPKLNAAAHLATAKEVQHSMRK